MKEIPENPQLVFYQSSLVLSKLEVEGNRRQGEEHIFLEKTTAAGTYLFTPGFESQAISIDIPQGTYSEINVKTYLQSDTEGTYQLLAAFINSVGDTIPILFKYETAAVFELRATSGGENTINLVEDNIYHARISLNMAYLFDAVPNSELEDAELTTVNSITTIEIDEDNNSDIYNILASRMNECMELSIE